MARNTDISQRLAQKGVLRLLIELALPCIAAQFLSAVYLLVDRMFIGHIPGVGTDALTGLGICFPILSLITAFSWLVGKGGAPLLSIQLGIGDEAKARKIQGTSFTLLAGISVAVTIGVLLGAKPLLLAFGASERALPFALEYLNVYVLGTLPFTIANGMCPFLNAQGHTGLGTCTIAVGAALNLVLDPIFIFAFDLGIQGAALASVLSQTVSGLWVLSLLVRSKRLQIRLSRASLRPQLPIVRQTLALGASSFAFMANECLIQIFLNRLVRVWAGYGGEGDLYIGALTVLGSLFQIFLMPLTGLVQANQPIVGYCLGAGQLEKMKEAIWDARVLGTVCASAFWAVFMLCPEPLVRIFTPDPALIALSVRVVRMSLWECFLFGFQMVNQHMFVAMGNAGCSLLFAVMRKLLLLVPLALILSQFMGVDGVFYAEPISTIMTAIATQLTFSHYVRKLERQQGEAVLC